MDDAFTERLIQCPLCDGDSEALQHVHAKLMRSEFPADELEPVDEWLKMLQKDRDPQLPSFHALILVHIPSDQFVAACTYEVYTASSGRRTSLLTYLVTHVSFRRRGFARRLCRSAIASASGPLLLEAHNGATTGDVINPKDRLNLYSALGFRGLRDVEYVAPSVEPGSANVSGLVLLVLTPNDTVFSSVLMDFLVPYWKACYAKDDAPLRKMLAFCSQHAELSVVKASLC
ncbi:Histidine kinase [Diplonema papillatum]|nr:Histidine kinase [Diplonema papillatum]